MAGSYTENFTEVHEISAPTDGLEPESRAVGAHNTGWLDMEGYHRAVFVLQVGTIAAGGTVDFLLQEATDGAGTGVQAIAGKAITQLTQAGGDGDDVCVVELRTAEMDVNNNYKFVRGVLTIAVDAALTAVLPIRLMPRYPATANAGLTEIVL